MRGILECWMKQSARVELFKKNQCNRFALHCKFHLETGNEIFKDEHYNHLQVMNQICIINIYFMVLIIIFFYRLMLYHCI
jgi:phosphorylase kinase alpha/beta subunit